MLAAPGFPVTLMLRANAKGRLSRQSRNSPSLWRAVTAFLSGDPKHILPFEHLLYTRPLRK